MFTTHIENTLGFKTCRVIMQEPSYQSRSVYKIKCDEEVVFVQHAASERAGRGIPAVRGAARAQHVATTRACHRARLRLAAPPGEHPTDRAFLVSCEYNYARGIGLHA
jgi:hypothetical protein